MSRLAFDTCLASGLMPETPKVRISTVQRFGLRHGHLLLRRESAGVCVEDQALKWEGWETPKHYQSRVDVNHWCHPPLQHRLSPKGAV
jgi:hypothetical protein